jgi:hypothetical protein
MPSNKKEKETNKNRCRFSFVLLLALFKYSFLSRLKFVYSGLSAFIIHYYPGILEEYRVCMSFLSKIGICTLPKSSIRVRWQALAVGSLTRVELWLVVSTTFCQFGTCMMDTLPSEI